MVWNLEEHALDLLDLVDLDVPHSEDTNERQASNGGTRDQHVPLGFGVGSYDRRPGLSADLVAELHVERVVDILPQLGGLGWEQSLKSVGQSVGPDGTGDCVTDSSAKVTISRSENALLKADVLTRRDREWQETQRHRCGLQPRARRLVLQW